jgi:hypothetical protein
MDKRSSSSSPSAQALAEASGPLSGILSSRFGSIVPDYRSPKPKSPTRADRKLTGQSQNAQSYADTPKPKMDTQGTQKRPARMSCIQRGILKALREPKTRQRILRGRIYGPQNRDVSFQKAAKTLTGE